MKTLFLVALMSIIAANGFAQEAKKTAIPSNILQAFNKNFKGAKEVKWDKEDNNYEASFDYNGSDNSVLFNQEGKIVETEIEIKVSQLPKNALQYLNDNYKNQKVKEAAKIVTEKDNLIYEAEIKGKDLFFDENGNFIKSNKVS